MCREQHREFCRVLVAVVLTVVLVHDRACGGGDLLCEWRKNPEAVADRCPEFFWEAEDQSAYRIIVSGSDATALLTLGDLWDSGKVETPLRIAEYAGKPLENGRTYSWRLMTWNAEGKARPWSEIQRFTMSFRELPRHLPHIRTFLNFGSKPELIASRYDITFRKEAKALRPAIITINYSLLPTMVVPSDKEKQLAEFCVTNGLTKSGVQEDLFVHYREDQAVTLHVRSETATNPLEQRIVPGWDPANDRNGDGVVDDGEFADRANPKASARRKSHARCPIYYWGPPHDDYVMNAGSDMFQRYLAEVYVQDRIKGFDGLFIDTTTPRIPVQGGGANVLEYPSGTEVERGAWLRDMQTMLARIKIAIGDKLFTANCWHATPFVLDGTEWENWLNISRSASVIRSQLDAVVDLDRRGKIQMVQYNPICNPETNPFGVKVSVNEDRDRIFGLALYYLINGDFTYFGFGQHGYRDSEQKYFPAIEADVGKPEGPYFVFASSDTRPPGENLLKNGSFEIDEDGDGNPDSWIASEPVEVTGDTKRDGERSASIVSETTAINNINRQYVTLKPSTVYTLSGWIRTKGMSTRGAAQIYPYEFDGVDYGGSGIQMVANETQDWTFYSQVFKTGADPTGRICLRVYGATGAAWFDDIRLVEGMYYNWQVLGRKHKKALVLVKPSIGPLYGDETATRHELDGIYRPLKADGSLGDAAREISLRNAEAAILMRGE